jgi:hypothetical protein
LGVERVEVERRLQGPAQVGQRHGREGSHHRVRRGGVDAERLAQEPAADQRQLAVVLHQVRQAAGEQAFQEVERVGDAHPRGRIDGAQPIALQAKARPIGAPGVASVAGDQRLAPRAQILAHVEERRALGRAQPLVGVRRVVGRAELVEGQRDLAHAVGAVDDRLHTALAQRADDPLDRQDQTRLADDVIDEQPAGAIADRLENAVDDHVGGAHRERQLDGAHVGPRAFRPAFRRVGTRVVLLVRDQDLLTRFEGLGQGGVDPEGGVVNERQALRIGAYDPGEAFPGAVQGRLQIPEHKANG